MWSPFHIFRPDREKDAEHIRTVRDQLANSMEVLRSAPGADAFLGRKTQEPFPHKDEAICMDRWLSSNELRPPK
jgi:hypothetical protein